MIQLNAALLFLLYSIATVRSYRCSSTKSYICMNSNDIDVFDNILNRKVASSIDKVIFESKRKNHILYNRFDSKPNNAIEATIEKILVALNDKSPYIEYWYRDEWMSLELHRDIDEFKAKEDRQYLYPEHGHVLYVNIGEEVQGPTIIYTEEISGIDGNSRTILPPVQAKYTGIIVVPAVTGRLLRFSGHLSHSVVRPPLAYLDALEGGSNLELFCRLGPCKQIDQPDRRSVVLFNTWLHNKPMHVSSLVDVSTDEKPTDESDDDDDNEYTKQEFNVLENDGELINLIVPLLGDQLRRGGSSTYIKFKAPHSIKDAFISKNVPSIGKLYREET